MQVLEQDQHRIDGSESGQLIEEGVEGCALALRRRQIQRRVSVAGGDREQLCDKGYRLGDVITATSQKLLQLVEPDLDRVVEAEAGRMAQLLREGAQGRVDVMGCPPTRSGEAWPGKPQHPREAPRRFEWNSAQANICKRRHVAKMAKFCGFQTATRLAKPPIESSLSVTKPISCHQSHGGHGSHDQPPVKTAAARGGGRTAILYRGLDGRQKTADEVDVGQNRSDRSSAALQIHQGIPLGTSKNPERMPRPAPAGLFFIVGCVVGGDGIEPPTSSV